MENLNHNLERSHSVKNKPRNGRHREITDKQFKAAIINMFKHIKENMKTENK